MSEYQIDNILLFNHNIHCHPNSSLKMYTNRDTKHLVGYRHKTEEWPNSCKITERQSPINLSQKTAYKKKLKPIKLDNFDGCERVTVKNTGGTGGRYLNYYLSIQFVVMVYPTKCNCQKPKISGGLLTQNYTLDHIHMHWPSEHTIDSLRYDLEVHFVFHADKYKNFEEALKFPYGLTVMSILCIETTYTASNNFKTIGEAVKSVATKPASSTTTTKKIKFHEFLPYDHRDYFTYEGSLTTPNCVEFVNWIIFKNHANISHLDYNDVTSIQNKHNEILISNSRSLQALNDRIVYMPDFEN